MKEESTAERASSLGSTIATIGSILIAVGFAWLIASNWHQFPSILKVLILLFVTAAALIGGVLFRTYDYYKIGSSLIVLGSLLFTLTIFLIAQIYNLSAGMQGNAWLLLICWVGVLLIAYSLDSSSSLIIAMSEFLIWIMLQHWAFAESARNYSIFGPMALSYLIVGVIFYGLSLLHKSRDHKFHKVYMWWTLFYITAYTFTFTFLRMIPGIWPSGITMSSSTLIFLIILFLFALVSFLSGVITSLSSGRTKVKEIIVFTGTIILLFILILSSTIVSSQVGTCYAKNCYEFDTKSTCLTAPTALSCIWDVNEFNSRGYCQQNYTSTSSITESGLVVQREVNSKDNYETCQALNNQKNACISKELCSWRGGELGYSYYGAQQSIPFSLWAIWIFSNIIFIILILAIIAYGTMNGSQKIVNLGILFFVIDLISRYIGFWMDYYRNSIAILSIIGGVLLILGGWLIEKWRKNLLDGMHTKENN